MTALEDIPQRSVFATLGPIMSGMLKPGKSLFDPFGVGKSQKPNIDSDRLLVGRARRLNLEKEFFEASANLVQKAKAMEEIKRDKLYLDVCKTWDEYCKDVLGRSADSVRLAFRALEFSEKLAKATVVDKNDQTPTNVVKPLLSDRHLRKAARLPDADLEELLNEDLPDLPEKIEAKTKARKVKTVASKPVAISSKCMISTMQSAMPERTRAQRRRLVLAKLHDALTNEAGENFLEAVEKLLENWGF